MKDNIKKMHMFVRAEKAMLGIPCGDHVEYQQHCQTCRLNNFLSGLGVVMTEMQEQIDALRADNHDIRNLLQEYVGRIEVLER